MSDQSKPIEITDSYLYKVTLVVAIPNYSTTFGNEHQVTGLDMILDIVGNEPEIAVLDSKETKLRLVETE
jgi:hypothetical protein